MTILARGDATAAEVLDGALETLQATAARVGAAVDLNPAAGLKDALQAFERAGEDAGGWRTGLPALDARLGRLQPGNFVIVAA
jgi:hypothetical protein